jgi:hypothetical protein
VVGKGINAKYMAYIENVVSFIECNLNNLPKEHLFNYTDNPDFDINGLYTQ